jgi:hypothetical protein
VDLNDLVMKKYVIFAPKYSESNGGVICLHYLAHLINQQGGEAYLCPIFENFEISKINFKRPFLKTLYSKLVDGFRKFHVNELFDNKILHDLSVVKNNDDWIVIYPEITFGNPLGAQHVVRWLLHNPGFHSKKIYYGPDELYFKYHHGFADFAFLNSVLSPNSLHLIYYPLHLYNMTHVAPVRTGTAYCLRKGRDREIQHDLTDSILIDGMRHEEIAAIFKRVKTFISYDSYTAYSVFAALCGCDSVVLPKAGVTKEAWYPNVESRYGMAYGFDDLEFARNTRALLLEKVNKDHEANASRVSAFIKETHEFFGDSRAV